MHRGATRTSVPKAGFALVQACTSVGQARTLLAVILLALFVLAPYAVPAAQAAATAPEGSHVAVDVPVLNVRAGPGTTYTVLGQLAQGTVLAVTTKDDTCDWLQVTTPYGAGWVAAWLVSQATAVDLARPVRIVAPAIDLDARVVPTGWHEVRLADGSTSAEWDVPAFAAGWLTTSVRPGETGNVVLAGHHNIDGEVFRYVVNLSVGDTITLFSGERSFEYIVTEKFILADKYVPYEQRVQNARWIGPFPDDRLTLVTCWPYTNNTHRVIVIAKPADSQ